MVQINANGAGSTNNPTNTNTDFSAAVTPLEFYKGLNGVDHVLGESRNKQRYALTVKDKRGILTTAYASNKLQEKYEEAKSKGEMFKLPKDAMVAPWLGNDGRTNWVLYLQADIDLKQYAGASCDQSLW
jgi:hypothetical protein